MNRSSDDKKNKELHGLYRALIQNMVKGVTEGFKKELNLVGIGYTAEKKGDYILINAGYSHPIYFQIPDSIEVELPNNTSIIIKGINKQNVGDVAAKIRQIRKPEPYKGKGIKYSDEYIRRQAGKTVGAPGPHLIPKITVKIDENGHAPDNPKSGLESMNSEVKLKNITQGSDS